jgi:hypothetical protein
MTLFQIKKLSQALIIFLVTLLNIMELLKILTPKI